MKFNQLTLKPSKSRRRAGRGIAAGRGKTAGRGTKGQKSRSGSGGRPFFEGGQTPLVRKLPKLAGFRSLRPKDLVIYTGQLNQLPPTKLIDSQALWQAGLIPDAYARVKLIKKGEIKKGYNLEIQGASSSAQAMVRQAGGSLKKVPKPKRAPATSKAPRKMKKKRAS